MDCVVSTASGKVRGYVENGIFKFHGIPYAKPPVGKLRFCMPEPAEPWEGVYDATFRRPIAPQGPSNLDLPMGTAVLPKDEDCLTLAVSSPSLEGKLPVAVWLHGGANCYCGGDLTWYDGASLARVGQIVEVNLNFRLGPLGFLCYPGVADRALSIEDQMLALRWIQENIEKFGGDSKRITLFGQSAGGNAIAYLLSRSDSEGLFHQVVLQSASLGRGCHTLEDAYEIGREVVKNLNIDPDSDSVLQQLQRKSAEEILQAGDNVSKELRGKHEGMIFKPVRDEWHTPAQTIQATASEAIRRGIRIMLGITEDEMLAFILERDPETLAAAKEIQRQRYELPDAQFAEAAAKGGCSVWKYHFEWKASESVFGSCHCLELPFVFGNIAAWEAPMLAGASAGEMNALKETMQSFWCQFFRGEEPNPEIWPRYTMEKKAVKHFDNAENDVRLEADK